MSDPVTWGLVLSAVVGGASAIQQGQVASNNAKSAANVADYNSKVAENNAATSRQQAVVNEEAQRRQAGIALGKSRAAAVESGTGLDGTSGDLYAQGLANADLDAKNILYAGELKGQGLDSESYMQTQSAGRYRSNASSAVTGSYLQAGAAALSSYGAYTRNTSLTKAGTV